MVLAGAFDFIDSWDREFYTGFNVFLVDGAGRGTRFYC